MNNQKEETPLEYGSFSEAFKEKFKGTVWAPDNNLDFYSNYLPKIFGFIKAQQVQAKESGRKEMLEDVLKEILLDSDKLWDTKKQKDAWAALALKALSENLRSKFSNQ